MAESLLIITSIRDLIVIMVLIMLRMAVALAVMPILPTSILTGVARNAAVLSLSMVLFPLVAPTIHVDTLGYFQFVGLLAKESFLGLLLGFTGGMVFWAAENVGNVIDNMRGATMAEVYSPATGAQSSPIGLLISNAVLMYFYCTGGLLIFLGVMFESYRVWPIATFFPNMHYNFPLVILGAVDDMLSMSFVIASPLILTLFLSTLALGLVNRLAPQLNVFFLSMGVNSAVAVFVLIIYFTIMINLFHGHFLDEKKLFFLLRGVLV